MGRGVSASINEKPIRIGSAAFLAENGKPVVPDAATAEGTSLLVAADGRFLGTPVVADSLRPQAVQAVSALRSTGLWLELLTGDTQQAANELAKQAVFDRVSWQMLPEDTLRRGRAQP